MTPIKDFLIALAFAYMYYTQGIKNKTIPLDDNDKEKLLFESTDEDKGRPSNNLQEDGKEETTFEAKKNRSSMLESFDRGENEKSK